MRGIIHVLLIQVEGGWYAQCLEVDIGAQGADIEEARHAFFQTWRLQAELDRANGREPFEGLGPAPERYQAMVEDVPTFERTGLDDDALKDVIPPPFMYAAALRKRRDSVPSSGG